MQAQHEGNKKEARKACYLLGRVVWDSLLGGCRIRCIAGYALIFNGNPASLRLKPLRFESSHPDKVEHKAFDRKIGGFAVFKGVGACNTALRTAKFSLANGAWCETL